MTDYGWEIARLFGAFMVLGAAIGLIGVLVGAWISRRARP